MSSGRIYFFYACKKIKITLEIKAKPFYNYKMPLL